MYENCKRSLANFLTLSLQNQEEVRPKSQRYLNMTTKPWLTLTIRRKVWACFGANGFMTNHVVLRIGALTEGRLSVRAMMTPYDVGTIRCVALHALLSDLVVWSLNSSTLNSSDPFKSFKPFNRIHHDCQTVRLTSVTTKLTSLNRELRDAGWQFCERSGVPIQTCTLTSQWVLAHSLSSNFFQHYHRLAIWNILWIFFLVKVIFWHACLIPRGKLSVMMTALHLLTSGQDNRYTGGHMLPSQDSRACSKWQCSWSLCTLGATWRFMMSHFHLISCICWDFHPIQTRRQLSYN